MKKLTSLQKFRLQEAWRQISAVIDELKSSEPLKGKALERRKLLDDAGCTLGAILICDLHSSKR